MLSGIWNRHTEFGEGGICGTYISGNSKNVFNFSDSFKNMHKGFITGGSFSSDPSSYIASGYDVANEGNMYKVAISTMGNNLLSVNNNGNNIGTPVLLNKS